MGGTSSVLYEIRNKMNVFLTILYHYSQLLFLKKFFKLIAETIAKCEEKLSVRFNNKRIKLTDLGT